MSSAWVIVSAHHCAPDMGSEHAVGWNLVSQLARRHALLLITQDNEFRFDVQRGVEQLRNEGCRIEVFFVHHGARIDGRQNNLRLFYYLSYALYQRRVLQLARELVRRYPVAAVHQLTIVGFREPGMLWRLGLPFIWGPVGGLVYTPRSLMQELSGKMVLFQYVRNVITWVQFHVSPRVRQAYRASQKPGGAFVAATPDIGERFRARYGGRYVWIPETGSRQLPVSAQVVAPPGNSWVPLRLLWVGALVDIKPLGLLLDALAHVPGHAERVQLRVIGDGASRARYRAKAQALGLNVCFDDWMAHESVLEHFAAADLFVLLSMKDLTTNVVFESLAAGLPVLCLDHHGYAAIVDSSCGLKIPLTDRSTLRKAITHHIDHWARDPTPLRAMRKPALARAAQFSWRHNADRIGALYDRAYRASSHAHSADQQP